MTRLVSWMVLAAACSPISPMCSPMWSAERDLPKASKAIVEKLEADITALKTRAILALEKDLAAATKKDEFDSIVALREKIAKLKSGLSNPLGELKTVEPGILIEGDLVLISVMYGVAGRELDITEEVAAALKEGRRIVLGNEIKGDPAGGVWKRSVIKYRSKGKEREKQFSENTSLTINMIR